MGAEPVVDAETVEVLVARAVAGDSAAWGALVRRHAGLVWSVARSHRLDEADAGDVCQTTWLRLTEHIGSLRETSRLPAWLVTTARRESLRLIAARGREVPTELDSQLPAPDAQAPSPELRVLVGDRNATLWAALRTLSARCQQLLRVMSTHPELSYAELSTALDIPIGGIGPTRGRCLEQLRGLVSGLDLETAT